MPVRVYVCLLACLLGPTTYRKSLPGRIIFVRFTSYIKFKNHLIAKDMNHGESLDDDDKDGDHSWTYSVVRAIDVTAWQSISVVCLGSLTHSACVGHWTPA